MYEPNTILGSLQIESLQQYFGTFQNGIEDKQTEMEGVVHIKNCVYFSVNHINNEFWKILNKKVVFVVFI